MKMSLSSLFCCMASLTRESLNTGALIGLDVDIKTLIECVTMSCSKRKKVLDFRHLELPALV